MLTSEEKATVKAFANGDQTVRAVAESIYRKYVTIYRESKPDSIEMNFLSEMFTIVPDYNLRANYRKLLRES